MHFYYRSYYNHFMQFLQLRHTFSIFVTRQKRNSAKTKIGKFFLLPVLNKACSKMKITQWGFSFRN